MDPVRMSADGRSAAKPGTATRRTIVAACAGNAIEWYDFAAYGFVAVYIGANFFPSESATVELLFSFAVFGLTFFVRPIGGFVIGSFADRIGRKKMLVWALILMSTATFSIGLLPTYASIGIAAPIMIVLLRCVQGFSAGGEHGTVMSFVVEHSPANARGRGLAWVMFACLSGFIVGACIATGMAAVLSAEAMNEWGWRIPFLIAGPLGAIGLYIRLKLEETPEFVEIQSADRTSDAPLRATLKYPRQLMATVGIGAFHAAAFYFVMTFMPTWVSSTLGRGGATAFWGATLTGVTAAVCCVVLGGLSDRVGRRPILLAASIGFIVLTYPIFIVIQGSSSAAIVLAQIAFGALLGALVSTSVISMTEIFPARVRASAAAIGYNVPAAIFGGSAPFIGVWLIDVTGSIVSPSFYLMGVAVLGLIGTLIRPAAVPFAGEVPAVGEDDAVPLRQGLEPRP